MRLEDVHLPNNWSLHTLEEIAEKKIVYGIVQAGPHVANGIPYIKSSNVGREINIDSLQRTDKEIHEKYKRSSVKPGDIVFSLRGNIGETSKVPNAIPVANLTQGTARISVRSKHSSDYIRYQLANRYVLNRINVVSKGSTFKEISLEELRKLKLPLPSSKNEENKIVNILSTWDKAIETVEKLIENSRALKKALMQQLLTCKKRLPGFNDKWQLFAINRMGEIVSGGTPDTTIDSYWVGNVAWATPTDITALKSRFIKETKRNISLAGVNSSSAHLLPSGSILVCTRATIGYLAIASIEITTNQGFKSLIPNEKFDSDFIYYLFKYYNHEFTRYACGSTFLEISKKDFSKLTFDTPGIEEQKRIANVLNNAGDDIRKFENYRDCLISEKKALMQQLLTGKRRVKVETKETADGL